MVNKIDLCTKVQVLNQNAKFIGKKRLWYQDKSVTLRQRRKS
jgi:hypothetical protein